MLDNTITITDGTTPITLNRVKQGSMESTYYLNDSGSNRRFQLKVSHTVPNSQIGESHLVRLDVSHYTTEGVLLRVSSAWAVLKTASGIQDDAASENATAYLGSLVNDTAFVERIVNRES